MTDNKKLPEDGSVRGEKKAVYGYTYGSSGILGDMHIIYANPEKKEDFFEQKLSATGSYTTSEYDGTKKSVETNLSVGETRNYTAGGSSSHTDGHSDTSVKSTMRTTVDGDIGVQSGKDYMLGVLSTYIETVRDKTSGVMGGSESKTYNTSEGDVVEEHAGNWHVAHEKDFVTSVKKNLITMVNEGDYALNIQAGNYDTHIKKKARIYADNDILIESATKITFKVGGSTIVMTPSNITAVSPRIDLNP